MLNKIGKNILIVCVAFIIFLPTMTFAAEPKFILPDPKIKFSDNIDYKKIFTDPQKCGETPNTYCIPWLAQYLDVIYKYSITIIGVLAVIVMMIGGFVWMTAGGSSERVTTAKSMITGSITGLVIALCIYTILYIINPDLTNLKPIKLLFIQPVPTASTTPKDLIGCCLATTKASEPNNFCSEITQQKCTEGYAASDTTWTANSKCQGAQETGSVGIYTKFSCIAASQVSSEVCKDFAGADNSVDFQNACNNSPGLSIPSACNAYDFSNSYGIDPNYLKAIAARESGCNPDSQSDAGACGMMQMLPSTANMSCEELKRGDMVSVEMTIELAAKYISENNQGNIYDNAAGYNSGYGQGTNPATGKRGGLSNSTDCPGKKAYECCTNPGGLQETQTYVSEVSRYYKGLTGNCP